MELDWLEMLTRLQIYSETVDEHIRTITRMHADGVLSEQSMTQELAWFAGFKDQIDAALETISQRIQEMGG